jgi:hypothetical protein
MLVVHHENCGSTGSTPFSPLPKTAVRRRLREADLRLIGRASDRVKSAIPVPQCLDRRPLTDSWKWPTEH